MNNMNGKHLLLFQTNQNKCTSRANWLGGAGRAATPPDASFLSRVHVALLHPGEAAPATQIFINCNSAEGEGVRMGEKGSGMGGSSMTVGN